MIERLDGPDWLTLLGARPWLVLAAARTLGDVHARIHDAVAPAELPSASDEIRRRVATSDLVPPQLAEAALAALDELPGGDRLCHSDCHPANVLRTAAGPKVIDWAHATRGDPIGDVARTLVILKLGALPAGTPPVVVALDRLGRRLLVSGYRRAYGRRRRLDGTLLADWFAVHAIHRLIESIDGERPALLAAGALLIRR